MNRAIWALSLLLTATTALTAAAKSGELRPRSVYWQVFPSDARTVKIDNQGRPWFEVDSPASIEQIKVRVEQSCIGDQHWVPGATILLFDSTGRIWLTPNPKLLLAYDPRNKQWTERKATSGTNSESMEHNFCGPAIEDNAGRVYIGDRSGCRVFDHGAWSYQPFYEMNIRNSIYFGASHQFYIPTFARDERGRIFAWTTWGTDGCTGTIGCWVHEGTGWHQTLVDVGERPGHISAVVPLREGKVLLCPEVGRVSLARVDFDESTDLDQLRRNIETLGSQDYGVRRESERLLLQLGPHVLPRLRAALGLAKSPEQRNRLERVIAMLEQPPQQPKINDFALANARFAGRDSRGNLVLWSDTVGPDGRAGRTAAWLITPDVQVLPAPEPLTEWAPHSLLADPNGRLFLARYQKGLGVITDGKVTQLSDETDLPFDEILGRDGNDRVYVRNRWHVAAIDIDLPDTRPTLPVTVFELSSSRAAAAQNSGGQIVAKLAGADHPFLSVYRGGRFEDMPLPNGSAWISDVAYLQPLHGGAMAAQEQPGGDVFFFDENKWTSFHSFRALIESKYARLVQLIDNRRTGIDSYAGLRIDANRNIWCVQWDHVETYDGHQWQYLAVPSVSGSASRPLLYCLPLTDSPKVVVSDGAEVLLAETSKTGINSEPLSSTHAVPPGYMPPSMQIDLNGRVWLPRSDSSATLIAGGVAKTIPNAGFPRLQDSSGRTWFVDPAARHLVVMGKNEKRLMVAEDAISEDSTIVEEDPASFWLNTRSGLRHLTSKADGQIVSDGDYFEKGIPKGACNAMWMGADHSLWFSGSGRLYRIELPDHRLRIPRPPL